MKRFFIILLFSLFVSATLLFFLPPQRALFEEPLTLGQNLKKKPVDNFFINLTMADSMASMLPETAIFRLRAAVFKNNRIIDALEFSHRSGKERLRRFPTPIPGFLYAEKSPIQDIDGVIKYALVCADESWPCPKEKILFSNRVQMNIPHFPFSPEREEWGFVFPAFFPSRDPKGGPVSGTIFTKGLKGNYILIVMEEVGRESDAYARENALKTLAKKAVSVQGDQVKFFFTQKEIAVNPTFLRFQLTKCKKVTFRCLMDPTKTFFAYPKDRLWTMTGTKNNELIAFADQKDAILWQRGQNPTP